jgi:hypothetical protein
MKLLWTAALGTCVLAGCASKGAPPQVRQGVAEGGAKTISVAPAKVACEAASAACPVLAAAWNSAKARQAVLIVGLPGQQAGVTGADFHMTDAGTIRLRLPSRGPAPALGYPATAFDVPLAAVSQIAYGQRSWVRVYLAGGRAVDENINSGDQTGEVTQTLSYFLAAVQDAGVEGANARGKGGLFDMFGGDD